MLAHHCQVHCCQQQTTRCLCISHSPTGSVPWQNILSPEFGTKFQREVPFSGGTQIYLKHSACPESWPPNWERRAGSNEVLLDPLCLTVSETSWGFVKYSIPYNGPLKKFPDAKISFIRPLGPLLGKKISTPNCPPFRRYRGKVWTLTPFFSKSGHQIFPKL